MRKLLGLSLTLIVLAALGATAAGQAEPAGVCCSLVISMPTRTVNAGTDVKLKVTITNNSREDVNTSIERLVLDVRDQRGEAVPKQVRVSKVPRGGSSFITMVVQPGKPRVLDCTLNKPFNMSERFDLNKPGQYTVQASWQLGDTTVRSNKVGFEIVPATGGGQP